MAWLFQLGRAASAVHRWRPSPSGAVAGLINGFWIAYVGLPSLAVTLAGLIGYRGVGRILVEDRVDRRLSGMVQRASASSRCSARSRCRSSSSSSCSSSARSSCTAPALGRLVYVIGNNLEAARYSGVRVKRVKLWLCSSPPGSIAALAGLLYAARLGSVRGDMALGFELDIITMVLLGGVSIFGGSGNLVGVGLSILVILNLRNGMGLGQHHRQYPDQRNRGSC